MEKGYPEQIPDVEGLISGHMDLVRKIAWHMHGRVRNAVEIDLEWLTSLKLRDSSSVKKYKNYNEA